MTTVNFPTDPTTNEVYTFGGRSWQWNGRAWQSVSTFTGYTGSVGYTGSAAAATATGEFISSFLLIGA